MAWKKTRKSRKHRWQPTQKDIDKAFNEYMERGGTIEIVNIRKDVDDRTIPYDSTADDFLLTNVNSVNFLQL